MISPQPRGAAGGGDRPRSPGRRPVRVAILLLAALPGLLGVAVAARITTVAATTPQPARLVPAQVRFLRQALQGGAAERMQGLFPEGFFFSHALTGLAAAATAPDGDRAAADVVRTELAALDSPAGLAPFPPDAAPAYGAFWTGWSLLLAVELARLSADPADAQAARGRAAPLVSALTGSSTGFLESYPGGRWPVDTVVAVAALARADRQVGVPGAAALVGGWIARTEPARDPGSGLLPHRLVDDLGSVAAADGPRASSSVLIMIFEPDIDPARAAADYRTFSSRFVSRELGWVGIREYPHGRDGAADVDSGPLPLGISFSASALGIGAARRAGDAALATDLDREAELFGAPVEWQGVRRYAAGQLPVGDAFLAWSRSLPGPAGPAGPTVPVAPSPLWWVWAGLLLLPAALGGATLTVATRRRPPARTAPNGS